MAMNLSGFANESRFNRADERRSKERQGNYWDRLPVWVLNRDTPYWMRFVSHPQNCPEGMHLYTVHEVSRHAGDESPNRLLCTESWQDARTDEATGERIRKDCFCCDLIDELEETGILDNISKQDSTLKEELDRIHPYHARSYIFPVIIMAREVKASDNADKTEYVPDTSSAVFASLWVKQYDGKTSSNRGFIHHLSQLTQMLKNQGIKINSVDAGVWVQFVNESQGGGMKFLQTSQPSAVAVPQFMDLYNRIPQYRTWGQATKGKKPSIAKSYEFQKSCVMNSWFGNNLMMYGVNWNDFNNSNLAVGMAPPPAIGPWGQTQVGLSVPPQYAQPQFPAPPQAPPAQQYAPPNGGQYIGYVPPLPPYNGPAF